MRLTCGARDLLAAARAVARAGNVLVLDAERGLLTITSAQDVSATGQQSRARTARAILDVDAEEGGRAVADHAGRVVKALERLAKRGDEVSIACDGRTLRVSTGATNYRLGALPVSYLEKTTTTVAGGETEHPPFILLKIPEVQETGLRAPCVEIGKAIRQSGSAMVGGSVWTFEDVLLDVSAGGDHAKAGLTIVATDTRRLAVSTVPAAGLPSESVQACVPWDAIKDWKQFFPNDKRGVHVSIGGDYVLFSASTDWGHVDLFAQLSDKSFPHYEQILPKRQSAWMEMQALDLLEALADVDLVARGDKHKILLVPPSVDYSDLIVRAGLPEVGQAESTLPATVDGEAKEISFNGALIKDFLRLLPKKARIKIGTTGAACPADFYQVGDGSFRYILMPLDM